MYYRTLFFDLDDTLYPPNSGLWEVIRQRMQHYMRQMLNLPEEELTALREHYLETYGTTLRGLQQHYVVDTDDYLAYVHDLPLQDYIQPDPALRTLLLSLPQKRWVFTNADENHARRVISVLGIEGCFDGIIDVRALNFMSKPNLLAYERALHIAGEPDTRKCILFDDAPRNLAPARQIGFHTILVGTDRSDPTADQSIPSLHALVHTLPELWEDNHHGHI
ncbi:MAG: pyrimidine 5'-nucleotidase [Anaerolineales bacterium]|nr:pyrimidine 5'-nucleotidase [Anaerolineales bacterium]